MIDNPSSLHPHETIDIPLDQIHKGAKIGDITAKSQRLEKAFLDSSGRVDTKKLNAYATPLPKALNKEEFLANFQINKSGYANITTPIGKMNIQAQKAWEKMLGNNSSKMNRSHFSGAFLSTLTEPLFIVREQYRQASQFNGQLEQVAKNTKTPNVSPNNKSIAKDSYAFFKPFISDSGAKYLISYAIDKNGELLNKTFYLLGKNNLGKIKKMIQGKDEDLLYFKEV